MNSLTAAETALFQRLGNNIRTLRLAAGLTPEQAAERAQMSTQAWQQIEVGQVDIDLDTLGHLAEALQVDEAELLRVPPQAPLP